MQIVQENDVIMGNAGASKAFTISASAKAFKVLSSNIYKNKIRAVVRELVCNAVDAHVLNSQTKPYEIQAPNLLDPRFIVRDFGPGLSHEDMIELYTTYFASTKDQRNDQIGALGLGSKSPFSYTSTFSVVSYFDGMVRVYQCMLSNGEPNIVKTHEEPFNETDQCGIEVIVPVKPDDIGRWENEIAYIMRPFKIGTYKILGSDIEVESLELCEKYNDDWFGVGESHTNHCELYAVYGNIVYPLDDVPGVKAYWLKSKYKKVYFHFPLGQLDIQPSREELSLDETTVENICQKVNNLNESEKTKDIEHLDQIQNKRELARQILNLPGNSYTVLSNSKTLIQGQEISHWVKGLKLENVLKVLELCRTYEKDCGSAKIRKPIIRKSIYTRRKVSEFDISSLFDYKKKKVFILFDDSKKNTKTTIEGLWISDDQNHPTENDKVITTKHMSVLDSLIVECEKIMGDDEVIVLKSSELEDVRKLVKNYGVRKPKIDADKQRPKSPNAFSCEFVGGYYSTKELFMSAEEIRNLSGYVIGMHRDEIRTFKNDWNAIRGGISLQTIKSMAIEANIKNFVVIRPIIFDKVSKNENVKCLFKEIFNTYKKCLLDTKADEYYYIGSGRFANNISRHTNLEFLKHEICGYETEKSIQLNKFAQYFSGIWLSNNTSFARLIEMCNKRYAKHSDVAKSNYSKKVRQFEKDYYPFYYTLNDTYGLSTHQIENISNSLKILKNIT